MDVNTEWMNWAGPAVLIGGFLLFKRLGQISPGRARELVTAGAKLIDVRSPGEFSSGHIPGALNVPLGSLSAKATSLGKKESPLILYCASGTRSAMARAQLKSQGFTHVYNLGAMGRW